MFGKTSRLFKSWFICAYAYFKKEGRRRGGEGREGGRKEGRQLSAPIQILVGHESPYAGGRMLLGHSAPSCGGTDVFHLFPSALHFLSSFAAVSIIHSSEVMRGRKKMFYPSVRRVQAGSGQGAVEIVTLAVALQECQLCWRGGPQKNEGV